MAAPEASDSEEDTAAWQRLREAAWDPALGRAAVVPPVENSWKRNQRASERSIREKICNHEQDGNELQTTPEFRAHIEKKLDTILDKECFMLHGYNRGWLSDFYIHVFPINMFLENLDGQQSAITLSTCPLRLPRDENSVSLEEDNGFRLFSSSVPGDGGEPEAAPRKRSALQRSNSSIASDSSSGLESDPEWQRCQEAAVTAADILKQSGLPPSAAQDSGQTIEAGWKKVKKKKKKKGKREESGQPEALETAGNSQNKEPSCPISPEAVSRTETMQRKRKRKRRKTEAGTE